MLWIVLWFVFFCRLSALSLSSSGTFPVVLRLDHLSPSGTFPVVLRLDRLSPSGTFSVVLRLDRRTHMNYELPSDLI
ncbi:MAG: hypothetical protein LBQ58_10155 [Synergistaceae bacterium]|nr:hypothetical protein [Synergistaceae bacterium]